MIVNLNREPDPHPWFVLPVVAEWWEQYQQVPDNLDLPMAVPGTRFRASWAGDCSRALAYRFAGYEETDPITVADAWRFNIGTLLHQHVQQAILKAFPGSEVELKIKLRDLNGSAHLDVKVVRPDFATGEVITTAVEVKSINGTGFRRMADKRNPEGVRVKYVVQGALSAFSMDPLPDELLVAVFSLENMSPAEAKKNGITDEFRRFAAQWTFTQPEFIAIAQREIKRINGIMEKTDAEGPRSIRRIIPDPKLGKHVVISPVKGIVERQDDLGKSLGTDYTWHCGYCPFQKQCVADTEFDNQPTIVDAEARLTLIKGALA